ncbi:hypothetical protein A2230_07490 [candidate division WOR-1 bacterium RIFOXYA2_FULL_36_21]|uniref:1-acyl-sn-glycerol-3-phosphate acyltransferase n=1 Tax=candidate division WOR-1 bacterium RIFOXYB2_FULL_36_35 TaxID=1802578 RepID=A0A1F4S315_UNCSA|nr:MAG: hypothetical protein A2230_07490 [candidate division WOR-1 bacterium RIFOXYA2_FULL_36_21]OGC14769.1 MAG: hypothetical protein A2290_08755 [candidate division WOR-1 bacterium RIFOXYB2_FULL_36_35]OGC16950.1 MAG: hypothetical protein A2282_08620 [candidate division WOR-1 bacterium RIFOXYA12_FULL_36_13]
MKFLRTIFLFFTVFLTFFVGTGITLFSSFFTSSPKKRKTFQRSAAIWSRLLIWLSGVPVHVTGRENIPRGEPLIFVSNHQGAIDILILLAVLPVGFRFIIKEELFKIPFFGWYLRRCGYIPVDRGTRKGALNMFLMSREALASKDSILIFPEGTRSPDGTLKEFKRGSMLLAIKNKVRVLPIAISGSFEIMPKHSMVIHSVPVTLKIGKPISLEEYGKDPDRANEEVYRIIESML